VEVVVEEEVWEVADKKQSVKNKKKKKRREERRSGDKGNQVEAMSVGCCYEERGLR
jgi:hypothetical protein